jgi:hypothetical protein
MEGRLLLDVVVGEGAAVLELLAGEDQALLVRGNALLVLDLGLDILRAVRGGRADVEGALTSMVSLDSTSRVIVLPVRVLTKI